MKITLALLCLGMAPWAMGSSVLDGAYVNPYSFYVDMAKDDTLLTSIQTRASSVNANSTMFDTASGVAGSSSTLCEDITAGAGEFVEVCDKTLMDTARLIAHSGGTIHMHNVVLDLSSYSNHMYTFGVENEIFTLNLSEIFTNGVAGLGGTYTGDLNIKIKDENMNQLIAAFNDQKIVGINILVDGGQILDLDSLMLSSNHAFINFSCKDNAGTGTDGALIPEPSTASLSLLALVALLARRRRRETQL